MPRLTKRDLAAIATALSQVLAGEVIDGYDDGSDEELAMREAMEAALAKIGERSQARPKRTTRQAPKTGPYEFWFECHRCAQATVFENCPAEGADDRARAGGWSTVMEMTVDGFESARWLCPSHTKQGE